MFAKAPRWDQVLINLAVAAVFGAAFWFILEAIQTDFVHWKFACCDRCGNILLDVEQPILAFCAALSFFVSTFLPIRGWTIILKAIGISFLSFEIYFLMTFWSGIHYQECTALNYPRGLFPVLDGITMQIETFTWALICAAIFLRWSNQTGQKTLYN